MRCKVRDDIVRLNAIGAAEMRFYREHPDKGLFLLPAPTGSGKTYGTVALIKQIVIQNKESAYPCKVFYITRRKDNLPLREMEKQEMREGEDYRIVRSQEDVLENIGKIPNWADSFLEKKCEYRKPGHPWAGKEEFKSSWKKFENQIKAVGKEACAFANAAHGQDEDFKKYRYEKGCAAIRNLRNTFRDMLKSAYGTKYWKEYAKDEWKFMGEIFPGMYLCMEENDIFLMTSDKFAYPVDTVLHGHIALTDKLKTGKASEIFGTGASFLLIIDETNTTCDAWRDVLADNAARTRIPLIATSEGIASGGAPSAFSAEFYGEDGNLMPPLQEHLKDVGHLKESFPWVDGNLGFKVDTDLMDGLGKKSGLLLAFPKVFDVFGYENGGLVLGYDGDRKSLVATNGEEGILDANPLEKSVLGLRSFINRTAINCRNIAESYRKNVNRRRKEERNNSGAGYMYDEMSEEEAFGSVARKLLGRDATDEHVSFLQAQARNLAVPKDSVHYLENPEVASYFNTGFTLCFATQRNSNNEYDELTCASLSPSPENMLVSLAKNIPVIGLSATANIDTPIGNFCLEYVKDCLPVSMEREISPCAEERAAIRLEFEKRRDFALEDVPNPKVIAVREEEFVKRHGHGGTLTPEEYFEVLMGRAGRVADSFGDERLMKAVDDYRAEFCGSRFAHFEDPGHTRDESDELKFTFGRICRLLMFIGDTLSGGIKAMVVYTANKFRENSDEAKLLAHGAWVLMASFCSEEGNMLLAAGADGVIARGNVAFWDSTKVNKGGALDDAAINMGLGKPVVVFSPYATTGTGVNMQFPMPYDDLMSRSGTSDAWTVLALNPDSQKKMRDAAVKYAGDKDAYENEIRKWKGQGSTELPEIDIPAIYVDCPTSIISVPNNIQIWGADGIRFLDDVGRIHSVGGFSDDDAKKMVQAAATHGRFPKYADNPCLVTAKRAVVQQTLGRLDRTDCRYRNTVIGVQADRRYNVLDLDWGAAVRESGEYGMGSTVMAVVEAARKYVPEERAAVLEHGEQMLIRQNADHAEYMQRLVHSFFKEEDLAKKEIIVSQYDSIRECFLVHPTSEDEPKVTLKTLKGEPTVVGMREHYMSAPIHCSKYYYRPSTSKGSGDALKVSGIKFSDCSPGDGWTEFSARAIGLPALMAVREFADALTQAGLVLTEDGEFLPGHFLLLPSRIAVLKGDIGEVVTKALFSHYGYKLGDMPLADTEVFDFHAISANGMNLYVDAKLHKWQFWTEETLSEEYAEKVGRKLRGEGDMCLKNPQFGDRAMIINVFPDAQDGSLLPGVIHKGDISCDGSGRVTMLGNVYRREFVDNVLADGLLPLRPTDIKDVISDTADREIRRFLHGE